MSLTGSSGRRGPALDVPSPGRISRPFDKISVVEYESAIKNDKFVVIAHGALNEIAQAKRFSRRPATNQSPLTKPPLLPLTPSEA